MDGSGKAGGCWGAAGAAPGSGGGGTPHPSGVPHVVPCGSAGQCTTAGSASPLAPSRTQARGAAWPAAAAARGMPLVASDRSVAPPACPSQAVARHALSLLPRLALLCGAKMPVCREGVAGQLKPGMLPLRGTDLAAPPLTAPSLPLGAGSWGPEGRRGSTPPLPRCIICKWCFGGSAGK